MAILEDYWLILQTFQKRQQEAQGRWYDEFEE